MIPLAERQPQHEPVLARHERRQPVAHRLAVCRREARPVREVAVTVLRVFPGIHVAADEAICRRRPDAEPRLAEVEDALLTEPEATDRARVLALARARRIPHVLRVYGTKSAIVDGHERRPGQ